MAVLVSDSFDWYTTTADAASGPSPQWDSSYSGAGPWALSANGRFTGSQSMLFSNSGNTVQLSRATGSNDATVVVRFAMQFNLAFIATANTLWGFTLLDGSSVQCGVGFRSDGSIVVVSNQASAPTVLATFNNAYQSFTWEVFEIEVVINNTTGSVKILKNGNTNTGSPDFSATGLNTRNGTASNQVNKVNLTAFFGPSTLQVYVDDFLMFNEAGAAPNAFGLGDVRAVQLAPASNSSVQFTPETSLTQVLQSLTNGTNAHAANAAVNLGASLNAGFTSTYSGQLQSVTVAVLTAATANVKAALYDTAGFSGTPGNVIATSNTLVNPVAGLNTITFPSPPTLVAGTAYWLLLNQDATVTYVTASSNFSSQTQTYASFPAAFPGGFTSTLSIPASSITITQNNWQAVDEAQEDGDTTYVQDASIGDVDKYTIAALPSTPNSIVFVKPYCFCKKTDAGARGGQIEFNSAGTVTDTTSALLTTTYGYLWQAYSTDPHTGSAWTASAVNALTVGPKVAS